MPDSIYIQKIVTINFIEKYHYQIEFNHSLFFSQFVDENPVTIHLILLLKQILTYICCPLELYFLDFQQFSHGTRSRNNRLTNAFLLPVKYYQYYHKQFLGRTATDWSPWRFTRTKLRGNFGVLLSFPPTRYPFNFFKMWLLCSAAWSTAN